VYFLVDINLPKHFSFFNHPDFVHLVDINPCMADDDVWNYALEKGYIILTKDADFYYKCLKSELSPKIIQFEVTSEKGIYSTLRGNNYICEMSG
jgi:predicted nuclease of predicted toxin-antitoxin system